ncbi:MAG: ester cyclase [Pseudomonadota bacterium]
MTQEQNQSNKALVQAFWHDLENGHSAEKHLSRNCRFFGPAPIQTAVGAKDFENDYWNPLASAFGQLQRETHIFMGGLSSGAVSGKGDRKAWVGGTGYLHGHFDKDYLSIPASNKPISIRWGEFCCIEEGKIVDIYLLLDFIDLMQQADIHVLPPARGEDGIYPPPAVADGVLFEPQDADLSSYSLEHIRRFIFDGLNSYDQSKLNSMGLADYFHPEIKWYGPGGIGACLSFKEFQDLHQRPWLHAFPDRQVKDLTALIAEGNYSGGPGWAGVLATHKGDYLDVAATGKTIEINGLDFWKRQGEQYIENWVFVDMIHLFDQMGIDLMARAQEQR